ncbi:MAG: hypothetical protein LBS50_03190 [Prevotellaceae bacterium]|jgi:hypothetical protein|nr:hypothetical protein [Prevotellaceae bacterium]
MKHLKHCQREHSLITIGRWFGMFLLLTIPLVNVFFLIKWAFVQKISRTRRNFAIAVIVYLFALILIGVILMITFKIDLVKTCDSFKQSLSPIEYDIEKIALPDENFKEAQL